MVGKIPGLKTKGPMQSFTSLALIKAFTVTEFTQRSAYMRVKHVIQNHHYHTVTICSVQPWAGAHIPCERRKQIRQNAQVTDMANRPVCIYFYPAINRTGRGAYSTTRPVLTMNH